MTVGQPIEQLKRPKKGLGEENESCSVGEKNVPELQSYPSQGRGACDLY